MLRSLFLSASCFLLLGPFLFLGCKKSDAIVNEFSYLFDGNGIDWPNHLVDLGSDGLLVVGYTTSTDLEHSALGEWDGDLLSFRLWDSRGNTALLVK